MEIIMEDSPSPMLTIPAIVQRALGTHNISRSNTNNDGKYPISNDNSRRGVIGGLQGYYLPHYLQLRTQTMTSNGTLAMSRSRRDDDDNESLLESPSAAAVEMTPRLVYEGSGGATNSSKSSNCKEMMKSRKRKRNYNTFNNDAFLRLLAVT
jgi:hypothetical protein